jgi:SAM-dependent methyltransferase
MSQITDSKTRFSTRVDDYVKYRPDYPRTIVGMLREQTGFSADWVVADIGCGTGISCRMFLENGNEVFGIEPNDDMRRAAQQELGGNPRFHAIQAAAEATPLADASVDLVAAAQAYHWFDRPAAAREFKRILRPSPGGWVAVMWNTRLTNTSPFASEYDGLLKRWGTDYQHVAHRTPMSVGDFQAVFGVPFKRLAAPNFQAFTLEELFGRVRSSSYTPLPGQPGHDELFAGVRALFNRHESAGLVRFEYETEVFLGRLCG